MGALFGTMIVALVATPEMSMAGIAKQSRALSDLMQTLGFNQNAGAAYACNASSANGGHAVRRNAGSGAMHSAEQRYWRSRQIGGIAVGAKLAVAAVHGET
jgi:hypothetical protein